MMNNNDENQLTKELELLSEKYNLNLELIDYKNSVGDSKIGNADIDNDIKNGIRGPFVYGLIVNTFSEPLEELKKYLNGIETDQYMPVKVNLNDLSNLKSEEIAPLIRRVFQNIVNVQRELEATFEGKQTLIYVDNFEYLISALENAEQKHELIIIDVIREGLKNMKKNTSAFITLPTNKIVSINEHDRINGELKKIYI